jgi:CelD/BcsL family acetyltransferase involved in cellulose biosynthesis
VAAVVIGDADAAEVLNLDDPRWRAFVDGHPQATPFHHPAWARLVADCYRFPSFALVTFGPDGRVSGGVPVVEVRQPLGPRRWVSLPFSDACAPLLGDGMAPGDLRAALARATARSGVVSLELRGALNGAAPVGEAALAHTLPLEPGAEELMRRFHARVRRSIRQAERAHLEVRVATSPSDLLDTFFALHVRTRQRLGVPVQPRRFFRLIWERMIITGLGSVLVAESAGKPVGALVLLHWGSTTVYKFGASDAAMWHLRPNHLLMWHAIRAASEGGYATFDFGRTDSESEGLRDFKRSWGTEEHVLRYSAIGQPSTAGDGRARRALAGIIRHSPAWVARLTGELLYRFVA